MMDDNIQTVLNIFRAIEQREPGSASLGPLPELMHPEVELCWPPSLPYGGAYRGIDGGLAWRAVWDPLQPAPEDREMNPRVLGANERNEVIVLYRQRGVNTSGARFETDVIGLYEVRGGKLVRAQMFYFDEAGTNRFLAQSTGRSS
jgi:ketosteroid isomerase-like protein